jgi:two-component system, OmpR family, phosphate regulon sensor histidine kinase PhoR
VTFQTKIFAAAASTAILALVVAGALFATTTARQTDARIEQTLVAEAKLASDLLSRNVSDDAAASTATSEIARYDPEADRIGELLGARVTFITRQGIVVGDSAETATGVASMESHAQRPEVVQARERGLGTARRHSDTINVDMLYVAVPVMHPTIAYVRVAVPLSSIRQELLGTLSATLVALNVALISALLIGWMLSSRIGQRVRAIAAVATRYRAGDLSPAPLDYGEDELGTVARALDDSVQVVGRQLTEQARDRSRMEAILAGMIEGVIVVDSQGRLQLATSRWQPHDHGARGCRRWRQRARGGPRTARHHRPPPRGSDSTRFRCECVARAPHAAHRYSRLRRSALRRRRDDGKQSAVP